MYAKNKISKQIVRMNWDEYLEIHGHKLDR